jgi:hypothetical protein
LDRGELCFVRELLEEPPFEIAVSTIEDREVGLVLAHGRAVDFTLVVPGVAVWAKRNQVVECVVGTVRLAWLNVGDFDWVLAAGGYRATVSSLDFN